MKVIFIEGPFSQTVRKEAQKLIAKKALETYETRLAQEERNMTASMVGGR